MKSRQARVLIVDDNTDNRGVLARRIQRLGHTVTEAANGLKALECLREQPFDLMLLDIMMPEMNGYQVLEHMHTDPAWRHIPVVVISALDDMDSVVRCIELGAEDYLPKPFNAVLLNARVAACLEKKWLRDQEQVYLAAVRREMQLGRQIQADFLPGVLPHLPGWEIAAAFEPAYEVAGDFYDVFWVAERRVGLLLGDVSGKGVGAALFMALTRSLLRAFSDQATSTANILDAVRRTNRYILRHHQQHTNMFATLFFGVLETDSGLLTYVNAGHPPPILVRSSGEREQIVPTAPLVGIVEDIPFETQQNTLKGGDILLAYTDGITEAMDAAQQMFGAEQLFSILDQGVPTVDMLLDRVQASVRAHIGGEALSDDVTMLAVKRLK
jgi:serine phosphatase RsbU (regulator of sigma subunit)